MKLKPGSVISAITSSQHIPSICNLHHCIKDNQQKLTTGYKAVVKVQLDAPAVYKSGRFSISNVIKMHGNRTFATAYKLCAEI